MPGYAPGAGGHGADNQVTFVLFGVAEYYGQEMPQRVGRHARAESGFFSPCRFVQVISKWSAPALVNVSSIARAA